MEQFDNVSVVKQANVYFDGRCVSHSLILADGVRKSVGVEVTLPADLHQWQQAGAVLHHLQQERRLRLHNKPSLSYP